MNQSWRLINAPGTNQKSSVAKIITDNTLILNQTASANTYIIKSKTLKIACTGLSEGFFVNMKNTNVTNLTITILTAVDDGDNQTITIPASQTIILYFDGTSLVTY